MLSRSDSSHPAGHTNSAARVNWNKAEKYIISDDVEGDVLCILDTDMSGSLDPADDHLDSPPRTLGATRSVEDGYFEPSSVEYMNVRKDKRAFELLSSASLAPGLCSMTRALTDALGELHDDYHLAGFTTFHLNQRMLMNPARRDTPSQLWFRLRHHERHIRLAPLNPDVRESFQQPRTYLNLRLGLRSDHLIPEQAAYLLSRVAGLFRERSASVLKVEYRGITRAENSTLSSTALAVLAVTRWRAFVRKRREVRLLIARQQQEGPSPRDFVDTDGRAPSAASLEKMKYGEFPQVP